MPHLVTSLILTTLIAGPGDSAAVAGQAEQTTATHRARTVFVVTNAYGSARGGDYGTMVVGVTETATPEQAVGEFRPQYAERWVLHTPSRTDTYVRFEDPISFVSDRIAHYAAQAGELVRNSEGKIRFVLGSAERVGPRLLEGYTPVAPDTVWAASAREVLLLKFGPKPDGELVERGAGGLYATYREKHERGSKIAPRCWQAAADVILTTRAGE